MVPSCGKWRRHDMRKGEAKDTKRRYVKRKGGECIKR
jgi:hypothetical protein